MPRRQSVQVFDGRPVVGDEFDGEPGDDSFYNTFPDLKYFVERFEFKSPDELVQAIKSDEIRLPPRESDRLNVFGAQIHVQEIAIWGAFFIIGQQLYFLLHLRTLFRFVRRYPVGGLSVPWVGVYSDPVSRLSSIATAVVLPAGLCAYLAYRSIDPSVANWLKYAEIVAAGLSVLISICTFATFLRLWACNRFL